MIAAPPIRLGPEHALAYLRELQPGAREVAVIGNDGALLAGTEGAPARAARALRRTRSVRSVEESLIAVLVGDRAIAAYVPDAGGALVAHDLRCVMSAIAATFDG